MAGLDYEKLEEALLILVQKGNRDAFPFWCRLVMASDDDERAEVVADMHRHIDEQLKRFKELLSEG